MRLEDFLWTVPAGIPLSIIKGNREIDSGNKPIDISTIYYNYEVIKVKYEGVLTV